MEAEPSYHSRNVVRIAGGRIILKKEQVHYDFKEA